MQSTLGPDHGPARHGRLIAGSAFVDIGQGMKDLAIPLLIVARTGRALDFGIAFAIQQIPTLLLSPLVGAWLDRRDRRLVLAASMLVRCLAIVAIGWVALTRFDLTALSVALFVLGVTDVVYESGLVSLTAERVAPADLNLVNGRLAMVQVVFLRIVGPLAAGALFQAWDAFVLAIPFAAWLAAAVTYASFPRDTPAAAEPVPLRRGLLAGFRQLFADPALRAIAWASAVLNALVSLVNVVLPLFALQRIGLTSTGYGVVLAVTGVAALAAGATAHRLGERLHPAVGLPLSLAGVAAGVALLLLGAHPVVLVLALCVLGFADTMWSVWSSTLRQRRVPLANLGATNGAYRTVGRGASPIGTLGGGALVTCLGFGLPFAGTAAVLAATAGLLGLALRRAER